MKFLKRIKAFIVGIICKTKTYKLVIEENNKLLDILTDKVKIMEYIKNEARRYKSYYEELKKRRDEFIKRIDGKIPDNVIGGHFENYKFWLAQPFIEKDYEEYTNVEDTSLFIDGHATIKALSRAAGVLNEQKK